MTQAASSMNVGGGVPSSEGYPCPRSLIFARSSRAASGSCLLLSSLDPTCTCTVDHFVSVTIGGLKGGELCASETNGNRGVWRK